MLLLYPRRKEGRRAEKAEELGEKKKQEGTAEVGGRTLSSAAITQEEKEEGQLNKQGITRKLVGTS